jgi:hypothetical protein
VVVGYLLVMTLFSVPFSIIFSGIHGYLQFVLQLSLLSPYDKLYTCSWLPQIIQ